MPLHEHEIARREENGREEVRAEPLRLRWDLDNLLTSDDHRLRAVFSCGVRTLAAPSERRMFEEVFLATSPVATTHDVVRHFRAALQSAAAGVAPTKSAAQWQDDASANRELTAALREAGNAVAFTCGVELLAPFSLELSSPTREQERIEQVQRATAERWRAGHVEHLQRATELLKQFESLRAASPQLSAGDVLKQINPTDQPELFRSLMLASAGQARTTSVWVAAGSSLVRIDPRKNPPSIRTVELTQELGPLRSVSADDDHRLWVGARDGVMRVDPDRAGELEICIDADVESPHGFSRVVRRDDDVWATHRDGGLVRWAVGQREPRRTIRPSEAGGVVRNLTRVDDARLFLTIDARLAAIETDGTLTTLVADVGDVIAILPVEDRVVVVLADGRVRSLAKSSLEMIGEHRPAARLCSAAAMPWLGGARLLLSPEGGEVMCVGLDDPLVTRFASLHHDVRMLAATADVVAGSTPDRQRVILWHSWDGTRPFAEVHVASLTKHRISGIAIG